VRSFAGLLRVARPAVFRDPRSDAGERAGARHRRPVSFRDILHLARTACRGLQIDLPASGQRLRGRNRGGAGRPFLARRSLSSGLLPAQGDASLLPRLYAALLIPATGGCPSATEGGRVLRGAAATVPGGICRYASSAAPLVLCRPAFAD